MKTNRHRMFKRNIAQLRADVYRQDLAVSLASLRSPIAAADKGVKWLVRAKALSSLFCQLGPDKGAGLPRWRGALAVAALVWWWKGNRTGNQ